MNLKEHNDEIMEAFLELNEYPRKIGIECPKCGSELMDIDEVILTSYPPKKRVCCEKCGYKGYRLV